MSYKLDLRLKSNVLIGIVIVQKGSAGAAGVALSNVGEPSAFIGVPFGKTGARAMGTQPTHDRKTYATLGGIG